MYPKDTPLALFTSLLPEDLVSVPDQDGLRQRILNAIETARHWIHQSEVKQSCPWCIYRALDIIDPSAGDSRFEAPLDGSIPHGKPWRPFSWMYKWWGLKKPSWRWISTGTPTDSRLIRRSLSRITDISAHLLDAHILPPARNTSRKFDPLPHWRAWEETGRYLRFTCHHEFTIKRRVENFFLSLKVWC